MSTSSPSTIQPAPHSLAEDALALITGTMLAATGLAIYRNGGIATGGTGGIALLIYFITQTNLGLVFFAINLPFYVFAYLRMGAAFTLKTFAAVALLSAETYVYPSLMGFSHAAPLFAAVTGGLLIGVGLLILIRHRASLGGIGVLVFYLQDRLGWPAGKVQLIIDGLILVMALFILDPAHVLYSIVGAAVLNIVLWVNHRPGRYIGY